MINWTRSELASINVAVNTAMCKIYKVKFCLLDDIYKYTGQSGVADTMVSKHMDFPYCLLLLLSISVFLLFSFSVFTHF